MDTDKYKECIQCGNPFGPTNTFTQDGWRETQISGMCESCFDAIFDEDENDQH